MFFLATELGMTIKELTSKLNSRRTIHWVAFFELKKEIDEKAIEDSRNKSRARKR